MALVFLSHHDSCRLIGELENRFFLSQHGARDGVYTSGVMPVAVVCTGAH